MPNPFESPRLITPSAQAGREEAKGFTAQRALAGTRYIWVVSILAVPAIINLLLFNFFVTGQVASQQLFFQLAILNAIGVMLAIIGLLFGGFFVLEFFTRLSNKIFGNGQRLSDWYEALFAILERASFLSIPAAVLWLIWLWLFYATTVPVYAFSVPIYGMAHLIAASLYGGLFWRWYKIRRLV